MEQDPRKYRLSKHFVLSDFLGCHSVYAKGFSNPFIFDAASEAKLENLSALCHEALEPILEEFGPLSVGYGYISPDLSRRIVKYQNPDQPSHHRCDLGAAADICVHRWVTGGVEPDLYFPSATRSAPVSLGHTIDGFGIPYSRLITYSESPYLCIAVSAREVVSDKPRKAFYENRYTGTSKVKPDYRTYSTPQARQKALESLQTAGLSVDWQGMGYPTYHGGGFRQYHHIRVSKYTMLSDWLFDLKSITKGEKNIPSLNLDSVQDAFAAAGTVYDWMVDTWGCKRFPIAEGYVSHLNSSLRDFNDWREPTIRFAVNSPEEFDVVDFLWERDGVQFTIEGDFIVAVVDVDKVLSWSE
jgi:hypothetical protein